jgi:SAM-dependent methyltransferase
LTLFFLRKFPSYAERLRNRDERLQLSPLQRIVPFLLFVLFNIICLLASIWYRITCPRAVSQAGDRFTQYFGTFGYWFLTGAWHKAMEGVHFSKVNLISPSLEIGFCRGNISALHFKGETFDIGSEYLFFEAKNASEKFGLWRNVYSDDLNNMALANESINTICTVHVIDHVETINNTLREMFRVLKKGGRVYLSGFSDHHFRYSLIWQVLNLFSIKWAQAFASLLADKRGSHNLLSAEQWRSLLDKHGLELESHSYTESGMYAYICYFLHFVCFSNFCFDFKFIKEGSFKPLLEKLFRFYFVSIGAPEFLRTMNANPKHGDNFFIKAIKN